MTEFKPGDRVIGYRVDGAGPFQGTVFPKDSCTLRNETNVQRDDDSEGVGPEYFKTDTLRRVVPEDSPRSEILDEAKKLITGDRNLSYGTPTQNFQNTADLWNVQLRHKLKDGEEFTGTDVALLMTHLKMARLIASGTKRDNYADAIGYMACAWETVVSDDSSE